MGWVYSQTLPEPQGAFPYRGMAPIQVVNHWQGRRCQMPEDLFGGLVRPLRLVAPPFDDAKSCRLEEKMIILL